MYLRYEIEVGLKKNSLNSHNSQPDTTNTIGQGQYYCLIAPYICIESSAGLIGKDILEQVMPDHDS